MAHAAVTPGPVVVPLRAEDLPPLLPMLSKRRLEFLEAVFMFYSERRNYPTTEEIAQIMDLKSRQGALSYIRALIKDGCLVRAPNVKRRYIRLTDTALLILAREGIDTSGQMNLFKDEQVGPQGEDKQ